MYSFMTFQNFAIEFNNFEFKSQKKEALRIFWKSWILKFKFLKTLNLFLYFER